jgi:hypothetical protein
VVQKAGGPIERSPSLAGVLPKVVEGPSDDAFLETAMNYGVNLKDYPCICSDI